MTIYFDMDGTIANLYEIENWLEMLSVTHDPYPYANAKPMLNMSAFARLLHKAQKMGYSIGIISWLAKASDEEYDLKVINAKIEWLNNHLPSVKWNEIKIVAYGTPKSKAVNDIGILFDDEEQNRNEWGKGAYEPCEILNFLRNLR